jgi:hypothetical protein
MQAMKEDQNKKQDSGKQLLKDINSVDKAPINSNNGNEFVDDPKRPAKGGRHDANSVQDGGQDVGSSAGSH